MIHSIKSYHVCSKVYMLIYIMIIMTLLYVCRGLKVINFLHKFLFNYYYKKCENANLNKHICILNI
jgi:hypothetical protein